jgi:hypothetical protein
VPYISYFLSLQSALVKSKYFPHFSLFFAKHHQFSFPRFLHLPLHSHADPPAISFGSVVDIIGFSGVVVASVPVSSGVLTAGVVLVIVVIVVAVAVVVMAAVPTATQVSSH